MNGTHPMLPQANHDETAEQLFVRDLKGYIAADIEPLQAQAADRLDPGPEHNARVQTVYADLHRQAPFRLYASLRRASQELLWDAVDRCVGRQGEALNARARIDAPRGSLHLDDAFQAPDYVVDADVHLMPGGYAGDPGGVEQGALMDRGGAVYMLGRNGGLLNDVRGWTLVSHLLSRWPELRPQRMLELGCGVGASIVPAALGYPDAEVHGLDVGASMLRYAHARAEHMGVRVHFHQGDAERAPFDDGAFDVVFSCVLLHETSPTAIGRLARECHRLLKPGGVVAHLEVPHRYDGLDLWAKVRAEMEADYNNEPNWKAATSADHGAVLKAAGFDDVRVGYQDATGSPEPGNRGFGPRSKGVFRSWFVASGVKRGGR